MGGAADVVLLCNDNGGDSVSTEGLKISLIKCTFEHKNQDFMAYLGIKVAYITLRMLQAPPYDLLRL